MVDDELKKATPQQSDSSQTQPTEPKKKHGGARKGAGRPKGRHNSKRPRGPLTQTEIATAIDMDMKGVQRAKIARAIGVKQSTITEALKRFAPIFKNLEKLDDYRRVRSNLLESAELMCLESVMNEEKHEKASLNNAAYALSQVNGIRRLEQGLSTSNKASTLYVKADFGAASSPTHDSQSRGQEPQTIDITPETEEDS